MGLNLRLEAKMTQSLVMTPRLQQAIKLLQYNHMEMVAHVQDAILENPTLEEVPDTANDGEGDGERDLRDRVADEQRDVIEQNNGDEGNIDWEKFLANMDDGPRMPSMSGGTIYDDLPPIETNLTYGESLAEHLAFQLTMTKCGEDEGRAADIIVQNLDHRGYLILSHEDIMRDANVDETVVAEALELVQGLDPIGCGAADLSECLIIQARVTFPEDDNFVRILGGHLHNLERRNYQAIARDLELDIEDVIEYHKMIQDLEPLPGRGFTLDEPRYITPDIHVVSRNGDWFVTQSEDGMPDLRISKYYQKILQKAGKEDKDYLLDKLRGAEFLIKSINKRRKTIRRVMESILKFQHDFFDHGADRLRPLVLQDVADDVGVHMSTVSRVTTNKYVHTAHGTFELKYFFSAAVRQDSGGDMAAMAIKSKIKGMVSHENAKKPMSDQAIANSLKADGINVARRTVAKYREAMGILPSSRRKQMF
ncbi:MAG: RNA polymerase factor sigma-54 [Rhodobacterales bacterium]|nr:RNA polymerase factor sigma-54 [Rhodobacterales bacterium]